MLRLGDTGQTVEDLQVDINRVRAARGLPPIAVDGILGSETLAAAHLIQEDGKRLQLRNGLGQLLFAPDHTAGVAIDPSTEEAIRQLVQLTAEPELIRLGGRVGTEQNQQPVRVSGATPELATLPTMLGIFATAPEPEPVVLPTGPYRVQPDDILEPRHYARTMESAGFRPNQQSVFMTGLAEVTEAINELPEGLRGPTARAVREMYINGYPVRLERNERRGRRGEESLGIELVPLRSGRRYSREHDQYFDQVMESSGLDVARSRNGRLQIELDELEADDLPELRLELEAANGGRRIQAIAPVEAGRYRRSSGFGMRNDPFHGQRRMHAGDDFAHLVEPAKEGETEEEAAERRRKPFIVAAMPGVVVEAGRSFGGYGNRVVVQDIYGVRHHYAHLNSVGVEVGDVVQQGDRIGVMGSTGRSTGTHLHYEQEVNGEKRDPVINEGGQAVRVVPRPERTRAAAGVQMVQDQADRIVRQAAEVREAAERAVAATREQAHEALLIARDVAVENTAEVISMTASGARSAMAGIGRFLRG